jgi:serine 3-dehydrogenase
MPLPNLCGQTHLVTGASSGIGEACARALAAAGARTILAARRSDRIERLAQGLLDAYGSEALPLALDVRDAHAVEAAVSGLPEAWSQIDGVVNNAGLARGLAPMHETPVDDLDAMVDTNIKGVLYVTRAVLPHMLARGRGHVVLIGSTAGHFVYPGGTVYCATKHAVAALAQGIKHDVHGTRVRVTSVDPGLVETDFSLVRFGGDAERAAQVYAGVHALTPDDVADAVVYALTRPPHVNIAEILLTPTAQSGATRIARKDAASGS